MAGAKISAHPMYDVLGLYSEMENEETRRVCSFSEKMEKQRGVIEEKRSQLDQIQDVYYRHSSRKGQLSTAFLGAEYLGGTIQCAQGLSLTTTGIGLLPGAVLCGTGALTLINRITQDTIGWDAVSEKLFRSEETQILFEKRICQVMQIAGVVGGVFGLWNSGLSLLPPNTQNMQWGIECGKKAFALTTTALQFGSAVTDHRLQTTLAQVKEKEIEITDVEHDRQMALTSSQQEAGRLGSTVQSISQTISNQLTI